ncbi:hypothetical protein JCM1840_006712 [Sporobolomyces johnsonii]
MSQFSPTYQQLLSALVNVERKGITDVPLAYRKPDITRALEWVCRVTREQINEGTWEALQTLRVRPKGTVQHLQILRVRPKGTVQHPSSIGPSSTGPDPYYTDYRPYFSYANKIADDLQGLFIALTKPYDELTASGVWELARQVGAAVEEGVRRLGKPVACLTARMAERYDTTPEMWAARARQF